MIARNNSSFKYIDIKIISLTLPRSMSRLSRQCGILNISQLYRPPRPVTGIALLYILVVVVSIPVLSLFVPTQEPNVCNNNEVVSVRTQSQLHPGLPINVKLHHSLSSQNSPTLDTDSLRTRKVEINTCFAIDGEQSQYCYEYCNIIVGI
jgi:hypothetical protein